MSDAPSSDSSPRPLQQRVDDLIAQGKLKADPAQSPAIDVLDQLLADLNAPKLGSKKSALGWLFGKKSVVAPDSLRGLYLWGGVGRGKSMLMDMFYELAPSGSGQRAKRCVHFHAFMQDVHARIHAWRQQQKTSKDKSADPIPPLAEALADEAGLLCFDEFAVTDVADAMLLARLFTGLFNRGVTVVATSNVEPDKLYLTGLNRSFFLPFIELVKNRMTVLELASPTDYRMEKLINGDVYMVGDDSAERFEALWKDMTSGLVVEEAEIDRGGRTLTFKHTSGGLVRDTFANLCQRPLGAGDYLAMAERFHTLFVEQVPVMDLADRNAAKRFISLVDTLYDQKRMLIVEAAERPSKLYPVDHGTEAFEFQRTVSRLREMQSDDWVKNVSNPQN